MLLSRRLMMLAALLLPFTAVQSQEMDMEMMLKWGNATTLRYHIVGPHLFVP